MFAAGTTPAFATAPADDPDLGQAWVAEIAADSAWAVTTGQPGVVVAVVDTGADMAHPDLAPNAWHNAGETANGADDDGDGLIDDLGGWSFGRDSGDVADPSGHGTHVAGLVGARGGNGIASAGVCWACTILPVDVYRDGGRGTLHDLARGMEYAAARARIVNLSLESPVSSEAIVTAVTGHPDRLFVVSAGNSGRDIDSSPSFPCALPAPNVLCVAADDAGSVAEGTNWGAKTVHLAAPGVALVSTAPGGGVAAMTGSSFAAPLVAGTAALLWSWRPEASVAEVRAAVLAGADRMPGWAGRSITGARLNAFGALQAFAAARGEALPAPPRAPAPVTTSAASSSPVRVPLAAPVGARVRRGVLAVRLACLSRTTPCEGTARVGRRVRRFSVGPHGRVVLRFARAAGRRVRVEVTAGARRKAYWVRVARA